jgi:hypothetical protein
MLFKDLSIDSSIGKTDKGSGIQNVLRSSAGFHGRLSGFRQTRFLYTEIGKYNIHGFYLHCFFPIILFASFSFPFVFIIDKWFIWGVNH